MAGVAVRGAREGCGMPPISFRVALPSTEMAGWLSR